MPTAALVVVVAVAATAWAVAIVTITVTVVAAALATMAVHKVSASYTGDCSANNLVSAAWLCRHNNWRAADGGCRWSERHSARASDIKHVS
jgi:hypothetical protein